MPFQLFLLRHAETQPQQPGQSDFDRQLLPKGLTQIQNLTQHLTELKISFDSIICSTAVRAKTTATLLADSLNMGDKIHFNPIIYSAEADELLGLIHETDPEIKSLMIVGHNPTLSNLGFYICKGLLEGLRTCDLLWIELDISTWNEVQKGKGKLKKLIQATPLK